MKSTQLCISLLVFLSSSLLSQNTVGLIMTSENASPGYTLFAPNTSTETYLIDNDGNLIRSWSSAYVPTLSVYLLEDGSLLRSAAIETAGSNLKGGFQKFSWEGDLLWEFYWGPQHHDIEPLPNGNVLIVANDRKTRAEAIAAGRDPDLLSANALRSLAVLEIEQTGPESGSIVWEWKAWDHLIQDVDTSLSNFGVVAEHPELIDINFIRDTDVDWLHTNSVDYHPGLDQILVSNRATNEIWIIDHSTSSAEAAGHSGGNSGRGGDLLYRWGNPQAYAAGDSSHQQLYAQHDARWVDSGYPGEGNITIFNNGEGRAEGAYASVVEISPPLIETGLYALVPGQAYDPVETAWTYLADEPMTFLADRFGGAHRLENGNTLICSPLEGRLFEVNPDLVAVWEYINPVSDNGILPQGADPDLNTLYRGERYTPDFAGFEGRDLTPGEPIEAGASAVDREGVKPETDKLFNNFPNPFNPGTSIRYELSAAGEIRLEVFSLTGRRISTLVSEYQNRGLHSVEWIPTPSVASGLYLVRLETPHQLLQKKVIYLK